MKPLVHVTSVEVLDGYSLRLGFDDGSSGSVDLKDELWGSIFEAVRDPAVFAQVRVDPACGTIVWPNGADFAPEWLYEVVTTRSPSH